MHVLEGELGTFCEEHGGKGGWKLVHYGQARRAPDWPPSAYIAQVKIWQFFIFKVLGIWGYGKLKAVTKEFPQDPILMIFGVNVVSEVIVPWSSYLVHLLAAYSW